ncbi:hypothetical protein [Sodalis sp. RH19]|uniref:hypothetical protein n=1 Tax=unclassified Sodalis (in: enterobacteria) TaxID=2636512 RepID=UPI0039B69CB3
MTTNITNNSFYRPEDNNAFNTGVNRMSGALRLDDRSEGAYEQPGVPQHIIKVSNRPAGSPLAPNGHRASGFLPLPVQPINPGVAAARAAAGSSMAVAPGTAHKTTAIKAIPANAETTASQRIKMFIKSLFTAKNINKAIRVVGVAMTAAALFSAVATLVGVAGGPLLIVVAVGFAIGALVSLTAKGLSRAFAKAAVHVVKNKSAETQAKTGGAVALMSAFGHNASTRGMQTAAYVGGIAGYCCATIGKPELTKVLLAPIGKAVGVMDTMMCGTANVAKQWGAAVGTAVAGCLAWYSDLAEHELGKVADGAASGSQTGASVGRLIDDFIFSPLGLGLIRNIQNQYINTAKSWYLLPWTSEEPAAGPAEWLAAISGGTLGGVTQVADIYTGGEITRIGQAADTARRTVSFGKLLRAAGNARDIRPGGTLNALHTAWQTVSFGKMVSAVGNYFELRIPHPA